MSDKKTDERILARLTGDFRRVAELSSVETALKISSEFGGTYLFVPKLDDLRRAERNTKIRDQYDKTRDKKGLVKRLARQYDLTTAQIYNILGTQPEDDSPLELPLFFSEQ